MEQFIGELFRHGRHQIAMLTEEVNVFVIRSRFEGVDFNRICRPVLEKKPESLLGKLSGGELFHELRAADPLAPSLGDQPIDSVNELFGFVGIHFDNHRSFLMLAL